MTHMTPRQKARQDTEARIVAIGNRMLDEEGAQSLSLRAVARELGIVSSAIYRYVGSRDELLTLLITDAFTSLADTVDKALAKQSDLESLALAMLQWSRRFPRRWALIYGTPIADYEAPREATVMPGTRVVVRVAHIFADGNDPLAVAGGSESEPDPHAAEGVDSGTGGQLGAGAIGTTDSMSNPALRRLAEEFDDLGIQVRESDIVPAFRAWVAIIGTINGLRFGQFGPGFDQVEDELLAEVVASLR